MEKTINEQSPNGEDVKSTKILEINPEHEIFKAFTRIEGNDELVKEYKNKDVVICAEDRAEIIRNLRAVDECLIVTTLDKSVLQKQLGFDAIFIGDDWKGNERWLRTESELGKIGVDVIYLPHTPNISSTMLRVEVPKRVDE